MALPDLTKYDDDKLDALRVAVLIEQERRMRLSVIPQQVRQLAQQYVDGGGDRADLTLDPPPAPEAPALEPVEADAPTDG